MQALKRAFSEGNFEYTQVSRDGDVAVYRQQHKSGATVRFEVIRIKTMPEHTWPNGTTTPAHEYYPSASQWGTLGFTCFTLEGAQALAQRLQHAEAMP